MRQVETRIRRAVVRPVLVAGYYHTPGFIIINRLSCLFIYITRSAVNTLYDQLAYRRPYAHPYRGSDHQDITAYYLFIYLRPFVIILYLLIGYAVVYLKIRGAYYFRLYIEFIHKSGDLFYQSECVRCFRRVL